MNKNENAIKQSSEKRADETEKLQTKLAELQAVYNQNEMAILGLYRNLENSRKQVEDTERQIRNANSHQQGLQRENDDLKKMIDSLRKEGIATS